jgi:hypothetical protein
MQGIGEVSDAQPVIPIARFSEVALAEVYRRGFGRSLSSYAGGRDDLIRGLPV